MTKVDPSLEAGGGAESEKTNPYRTRGDRGGTLEIVAGVKAARASYLRHVQVTHRVRREFIVRGIAGSVLAFLRPCGPGQS